MGKTNKSVYNVVFGVLSQIITLILGVIIPRLYLVNYGSDVNGFLTTINQLYVYVGLLEAGIGTVSLHALYKPIAEKNQKKISAIMSATNHYYKRTSLYYVGAVILLSAIFPFLIKVNYYSISKITMSAVIFINGLSGVMLYCFHGKYKILLQAEGKNYIIVNLNTVATILTNIFRIILVSKGFSIIVIQLAYLATQFLQMLVITIYINKKYEWLNLKEEPDLTAITQKNAVFVHQISSLIFNNTDALLLSTICGATVASIYSIYTMFYGVFGTLLSTLNSAVMYKLADSYHTNRALFKKQYLIFEECIMCLTIGMFGIFMKIIPDFMKLYTAGVTDISYVDFLLPILFTVVYILNNLRTTAANMITISGNFKKTQWRSVVETVINLTVSLVGVYQFGIYGVLIGTIAALFYRTNDYLIFNYKYVIKEKISIPYSFIVKYIIILALVLVVSRGKFKINSGYVGVALEGGICGILYLLTCVLTFLIQNKKNGQWKLKVMNLVSLFITKV